MNTDKSSISWNQSELECFKYSVFFQIYNLTVQGLSLNNWDYVSDINFHEN
jgi:hypothetical protein